MLDWLKSETLLCFDDKKNIRNQNEISSFVNKV